MCVFSFKRKPPPSPSVWQNYFRCREFLCPLRILLCRSAPGNLIPHHAFGMWHVESPLPLPIPMRRSFSSEDEICHTRFYDTSGCWVWCASFKPKHHICRRHLNAAKENNVMWSQWDYSLFWLGLHLIELKSIYLFSFGCIVIMTQSHFDSLFINIFLLIMAFKLWLSLLEFLWFYSLWGFTLENM